MTPALWTALAVGIFLGVNGGVILAGLLASGGREDAVREAYRQGQADALSAPSTEALIRSVAVATVELVVGEHVYPGRTMARRNEIADRILEATQGAARDFGDNAA